MDNLLDEVRSKPLKEKPKIFFRVTKQGPISGIFLPYSFRTKVDARWFLTTILKEYKKSALPGFKNQNRWATRDKIRVFQGSDEYTYTIEKVEKNHK